MQNRNDKKEFQMIALSPRAAKCLYCCLQCQPLELITPFTAEEKQLEFEFSKRKDVSECGR